MGDSIVKLTSEGLSGCNERRWEWSQPRLRCCKRKMATPKGKSGGLSYYSNLFPGHFCHATEAKGIKRINNFIWKSSHQKKVVVKKETAELPTNMGGLAVPNLKNFWDSLKLA